MLVQILTFYLRAIRLRFVLYINPIALPGNNWIYNSHRQLRWKLPVTVIVLGLGDYRA